MTERSNLFFRTRENGALVFRMDTENRQKRMELQQIAIANIKIGNIKPHGDQFPTASERNEIDAWIINRRKLLEIRRIDDIQRMTDYLSETAQWVQSSATDDQVDEFMEDLLIAMHDLRTVLIRRKSNAMFKNSAND